ncbi:hypothetical protein [Paraflavitalea pollutisoli]|uniref:hypothetical protein n=1 Tax=Paraflavitalea pollutisoli TaxID=3034143 RepID=UPI0023EC8410|nr:hypothetical protein [Paraflavitalea sp. H1-2-19X]
MKNKNAISCILAAFILMCVIGTPGMAQDAVPVPDTSATIPIKDLPIASVKATGDRKTGNLTVSIEFENKWSNTVDVSLSVGGWDNFGFTSDKGAKYKVHTYYNKMTDENPNSGYKQVTTIKFGEKEMTMATVLPQSFSAGENKIFVVKVTNFEKLGKSISQLHLVCSHYYQYGGGINSSGEYKLKNIPIVWY